MTLRSRIVSQALAVVGLGADPVHLAAFSALLGGPNEAPEMAHSMACDAHSSTCGLVVRALYRDCGVDDRRLRAPYRIGMAIIDLFALARERGASVDAVAGVLPCAGDVVGLALDGPDAGRHGHVYTVVTEPVAVGSGWQFDSVDGGQLDAQNRQCVTRRTRTWTVTAGRIYDWAPGSLTRSVSRWIDADKIESGGAMRVDVESDPADASLDGGPL